MQSDYYREEKEAIALVSATAPLSIDNNAIVDFAGWLKLDPIEIDLKHISEAFKDIKEFLLM